MSSSCCFCKHLRRIRSDHAPVLILSKNGGCKLHQVCGGHLEEKKEHLKNNYKIFKSKGRYVRNKTMP